VLDALLASIPSEMVASLTDKLTAKGAWDSIAATRVGLNRAWKVMVQKQCQEWDHLTFWPGEDVDDYALRLSSLVQQLARHGDNDIDEQKAVEKYLHIVPNKYT
jgi:broad specificity phosphatase PhoE